MKIRTEVKAGAIVPNHNERTATDKKRENLTVKSGVKAGGINIQHNEKMTDDDVASIEQKESFGKKLRLSKETIRELKSSELKLAAGGAVKITDIPTHCSAG